MTGVAIKIIDVEQGKKDYVMKNLTREAKVLSMLQHPSIVRLYETIRYGSVYYLVTELATGGDLCTHIKEQPAGKLDENTARLYARQLVAALKHMHSKGVVHRDLKMENIVLQDERKEQIKIVDFGLSNIYASDDPLRTHCGSPEYAAPELFVVGKRYGPEVDLWSLMAKNNLRNDTSGNSDNIDGIIVMRHNQVQDRSVKKSSLHGSTTWNWRCRSGNENHSSEERRNYGIRYDTMNTMSLTPQQCRVPQITKTQGDKLSDRRLYRRVFIKRYLLHHGDVELVVQELKEIHEAIKDAFRTKYAKWQIEIR
ncbi:PREDICTED: hormonally up-regulated neu tumor-associated kinase-like [Cyphomyrmex costatus]|uniref:hormonally up-regulated neu tumor-associated kinase-like n=1 Tax=Cyphomyrmex costatus TaxID=456900 RepID=UPI00085221E5|nr:PREDICTED: hormonally up-regulated neu tumor-associated kinase-like [Cyphomyrmex costatus]